MENGVDYYIFLLQISDAITFLAKIHINLWDPQKGCKKSAKSDHLAKIHINLWDPQKDPRVQKKGAKSAILTSSMTVELLLVGQSLFKAYDLW